MKKGIFILFLITSLKSFSQCNLSTIFPYDFGQNKFDLTQLISLNSSLTKHKLDDAALAYNNGWRKYDYLKNDSIYRVNIILDHKKDECFNGNENIVYLQLADDKLYRINILQQYSKDRYEEMLADYKRYINLFLDEYPYDNFFKLLNSNTNEKIGEGADFFKVPKEKRNLIKSEKVSISYNIEYKTVYDRYDQKSVTTSEVNYYEIEITNLNLKGTKLTNKGY
jgi:hypothetical protein